MAWKSLERVDFSAPCLVAVRLTDSFALAGDLKLAYNSQPVSLSQEAPQICVQFLTAETQWERYRAAQEGRALYSRTRTVCRQQGPQPGGGHQEDRHAKEEKKEGL